MAPPDARILVEALRRRGLTLAVAESLTGGLLGATLSAVPGASAVLRGGVIAYHDEAKHALLGIPRDLLARAGAVSPEAARAMAEGCRARLGADLGVALTGVAGPEPSEGHAPGLVHVGLSGRGEARVLTLRLDGDRDAVRHQAVARAVAAVLAFVENAAPPPET